MLVSQLPLARHPFCGDLEQRRREVERQFAFLVRRFTPQTIFLHDCRLGAAQLAAVHASLAPGDVFFDTSQRNKGDVRALLSQAGFARLRACALVANRAVRCPGFLQTSLLARIKSR